MPPKAGANKKAVAKAASKIVEDKTFGLKNKRRSKVVQAYVQSVKKQVDVLVERKLAGGAAESRAALEAKKAKAAQEQAEKVRARGSPDGSPPPCVRVSVCVHGAPNRHFACSLLRLIVPPWRVYPRNSRCDKVASITEHGYA